MNIRWVHSCYSLLALSIVFCASTPEQLEAIQDVIARGILLRAPYLGISALKDLAEKRLEMFYGFVVAPTITNSLKAACNYNWSATHENRAERLPKSYPLFSFMPTFLTRRPILIASIEGYMHRCTPIGAIVDISTFKQKSFAIGINALQAECSLLEKSSSAPITSLDNPLNAYINSPHAPRIYHQLFKVFSAYRNVVLDAVTRLPEFRNLELSIEDVSSTIEEFLWNSFFPTESTSFELIFYVVPIELETFDYAPGQFVKRDSILGYAKDGIPVKAMTDFVIKDCWLEDGHLYYDAVDILVPLGGKLKGVQAPITNPVIRELERSNLDPKGFEQDATLKAHLMHDVERLMRHLMGQSGTRQHQRDMPISIKPDEARLILRTINHEAQGTASPVSQRFESAAVRERVQKAESNAWWDAAIPGLRTRSLTNSEMNALLGEYITPFTDLSTALSIFPRPHDRLKGVASPLKATFTASSASDFQEFQQTLQNDDIPTAKRIFDDSDDALKKRCGGYLASLGEDRLAKLIKKAGDDFGAWIFGILLVYADSSLTEKIFGGVASNKSLLFRVGAVIDLLRSPGAFVRFWGMTDRMTQLPTFINGIQTLLAAGRHDAIDGLLFEFEREASLIPAIVGCALGPVFYHMRQFPNENVIRYAKQLFTRFPDFAQLSSTALYDSYSMDDSEKEYFHWFLVRVDSHDLNAVKKDKKFSTMPPQFRTALNNALKTVGTRTRLEKRNWNRKRFASVSSSISRHIPKHLFPIIEDYAFE